VSSFGSVGASEVVVVGRAELVPPLTEDEHVIEIQGLDVFGVADKFRYKIHIHIGDEIPNRTFEPDDVDFGYDQRIVAKLGEDFYVPNKKHTLYILGAGVLVEHRLKPAGTRMIRGRVEAQYDSEYRRIILKETYRVDIQPEDKAVYIGTLRIHRDEFSNITRTEIADDYERARSAFEKKFGTQHELRKAILKPVNGGS
jgi:hypothetical protein